MKHAFHRAALAVIALLCLATPMAYATTGAVVIMNDASPPNLVPRCDFIADTGQTYATTGYADVVGNSIAGCIITPTRNDPTTAALAGGADRFLIWWDADVIKATTTTGTCAVWANGAIITDSARTIDVAAKEGSIGGTRFTAQTVAGGTNTIKLQCKSGDTAVFTVNNAHIVVMEDVRFIPGSH